LYKIGWIGDLARTNPQSAAQAAQADHYASGMCLGLLQPVMAFWYLGLNDLKATIDSQLPLINGPVRSLQTGRTL